MNVENPLLFMMALWTIFTVGEMVADKGFVRPTTWWQRNAWWMRWLLWGIGMAIAVALTVFSFGAGGFLIAAVAATTGLVIGGVVGGRNNGGWCWDTAKQGASLGVMVATAIMSVVGGIAGSVGKLGAKKVNKVAGVKIVNAKQSMFTPEAWATVQGLGKNQAGHTVSSLAAGQKAHKGFMVGKQASIKGGGSKGGWGFMDALDGRTIFELKPNNPAGITKGIKQLIRYQQAYFVQNKKWLRMFLVLY